MQGNKKTFSANFGWHDSLGDGAEWELLMETRVEGNLLRVDDCGVHSGFEKEIKNRDLAWGLEINIYVLNIHLYIMNICIFSIGFRNKYIWK